MKRAALRITGVALASIFTTTLLISTPAEADIYQCYTYPSDSVVDAYCSGTPPSEFRAWATCTQGHLRYGVWRTAGSGILSRATCPVNTFVVQDGVETRR